MDRESKYLLPPHHSPQQKYYGLNHENRNEDDGESDDDSDEDDEIAKANLLRREQDFTISYDVQKGYRGTELKLTSFARPHMRAFHASWACFFASFFTQFAVAPLLPVIGTSLHLSKKEVWQGNLAMMVGGLPCRLMLGPVVEKLGGRITMTAVLFSSGIVCGLTAFVYNATSLSVARFLIGVMDTFLPNQFWITCLFVREIAATAMAISSGLGSVGSAFTQIALGTAIFPLLAYFLNDDEDLAWRLSLIFPAIFAVSVAWFFSKYSDDCPLGNFKEVKRAGLMVERSAVDSFRSGALNINSWLLFLQFAFSCGVDFTMSNGAAMYYHKRFDEPVATVGALAFLYGISALYARALGGYLSDFMGENMSLRGRLLAQFLCMIIQGILNVWFARMDALVPSVVMMIIFSIFVQMSMGTCFGIVPYIDGPNIGSVAGITAAGGNVGGAICSLLFISYDYDWAMELMGWFTVCSSFLTFLIVVRGYRGLVFGTEDEEGSSTKAQHSPLVVPGKMQHSPHLVAYRRKQRRKSRMHTTSS